MEIHVGIGSGLTFTWSRFFLYILECFNDLETQGIFNYTSLQCYIADGFESVVSKLVVLTYVCSKVLFPVGAPFRPF